MGMGYVMILFAAVVSILVGALLLWQGRRARETVVAAVVAFGLTLVVLSVFSAPVTVVGSADTPAPTEASGP